MNELIFVDEVVAIWGNVKVNDKGTLKFQIFILNYRKSPMESHEIKIKLPLRSTFIIELRSRIFGVSFINY